MNSLFGLRTIEQLVDKFACISHLFTGIDAFKQDSISETILRRLLSQDVIHHVKVKCKEKNDPAVMIYEQGKAADYFVLILEGRVDVTVGNEALQFECGPFTYFGTQALVQNVGVGECIIYAARLIFNMEI